MRFRRFALPALILLLLVVGLSRPKPPKKPGTPVVNSNKEEELHPELRKRWRLAAAEYARRFPSLPRPYLAYAYRSMEEQARLYAVGRARPGQLYVAHGVDGKSYPVIAPSLKEFPDWRIITNARPGQSLHNYRPALAFDVAFQDGKGGFSCLECFQKFGQIAKSYGLEWGGDWRVRDYPHFQPPNYTWQMAQAGVPPRFTKEV
ncbi:endolysin [Thermus phage P23-77]|uniref:Endolysin n=1 Tax=Thermus virus P23-77 TaxID=1714272 RepID=C8CHK7_9VIRU|nr:endolysin [Thermus phage P23-77]ACV05036.1 endolysin [Thermus phage P23-77]